jgi:hypothetical protein
MCPLRVVPAGYESGSLESAIRERFACEARWRQAWQVYLVEDSPWTGVVHEYELHDGSGRDERCFGVIVLGPGGERHDVLIDRDLSVRNAEDAARAMLRRLSSGSRRP